MGFNRPEDKNLNSPLWNVIRKKLIQKTPVFSVMEKVTKMPGSDKSGVFYTIEAPDWVNVIALTPENEIILVEQYRHGIHEVTLEIPGGVIDPGMSEPVEAARAELSEETGYTSARWSYLGSVSTNPALFSNRCHLFLAENCTKTQAQKLDTHESIQVHLIPLEDFLEQVRAGKIHHALVVSAVAKFLLARGG